MSGALCLAIEACYAERFTTRRAAVLGLVLGLGLLTKFTSLALAPLVAAFAAARVTLIDGRSALRAAGVGAGILAVAAAVAGWFYVRNWILFGDPTMRVR